MANRKPKNSCFGDIKNLFCSSENSSSKPQLDRDQFFARKGASVSNYSGSVAQLNGAIFNAPSPNTNQMNDQTASTIGGAVVKPASRQAPPGVKVYMSGKFDLNAKNFVYIPRAKDGKGFSKDFMPYRNTGDYTAAIPIVVGQKHAYLNSDGSFEVLTPDGHSKIHKGKTSVRVNGWKVSIGDFEKVPVAYVPLHESDLPTDDSTKPAYPFPAKTSPYKPAACEGFLVYYDGKEVSAYGERYVGFVRFSSNNHAVTINDMEINVSDFKAVRIDESA